jgi:hypothetical protein
VRVCWIVQVVFISGCWAIHDILCLVLLGIDFEADLEGGEAIQAIHQFLSTIFNAGTYF